MRLRCLLGIVLSCGALPASADDAGKVVRFSGRIDARSVGRFIARHEKPSLERIVLDSEGGDIGEALVLANWIVDHELDVEVGHVCASSCANYLFAAGRRKIIDDGALVVWHGSALQKDFREWGAECERRLLEFEHAGGGLADRYLVTLESERESCMSFAALVEQQASFFRRVGVDEYITRMGQEPHAFKAAWTVPVDVMERMGLRGVEAPSGYASAAYLRRFNRVDDPGPILSLGFDGEGRVVELAR